MASHPASKIKTVARLNSEDIEQEDKTMDRESIKSYDLKNKTTQKTKSREVTQEPSQPSCSLTTKN